MAAAPQVNYANYPLKAIPQPHPHDVLCGRGGGTNNHIGNSHWRMLVAANKQLYITLPKRQKMLLSRSIVNAVRSQNPPGRFLQKDSKTNKWFDVGDQRAQEKTSQALREGAPDIRKKVAAQSDSTEDVEPTESATESPGDKSSTPEAQNEAPEEAAEETKAEEPPAKKDDEPAPTPTPSASPPAAAPPAATPAPAPQMPHYPMGGMPPQYQMPNGGMPFMPQGGQPGMVYYAGPNMQPMQVYPTMVLNEQGMMVPAMSLMPHGAPGGAHMMQHPQAHHGAQSAHMAQAAANNHHQQQQQQRQQQQQQHQQKQPHNGQGGREKDDFEPMPLHLANGADQKIPTFDEYVAAPDGLDPAGLSFGSVTMTDVDMNKLQATGASFGSAMNYRYANNNAYPQQQQQHHPNQSQGQQGQHDDNAPQAPSTLEATGLSFGDVSMMSTGSKLEAGGTSFGTMMSLEQIGTSFGSLSLDPGNREMLFQQLELAASGPEIPPMFHSEDKATGNLLDCSDTESEDSRSKPELSAQKSEAWEKMQASVAQTQLYQTQSKGTLGSNELMPPPTGRTSQGEPYSADMKGTVLSVPTTQFNRDFSQLSAWGDDQVYPGQDDDDDAAPPPQLQKQGSDDDDALIGYMSKQER